MLLTEMEEETDANPNNNHTSEIEPDALTNKKHLAMLDRLSNLNQTRSAARHQPEPESDSQNLQAFLSLFSSSKLSIQSDLSRLLTSDPKPEADSIKPDLNRISASILDLERILAQNSYFLPSYELRSSLKSISDLKETLEKANSQLIPRKKFSFKKNSALKKDPTEVFKNMEEKSDARISFKQIKDSPGFRNKKEEILVKNFRGLEEGHGDFTLSDLDSCKVYLRGKIRALFINRIMNCQIFCGPVLGAILIEDVSDSLFVLASHQIRIHQAKRIDFYLRVRSRPIIEDCSGVRFGPYRLSYEGIEDDLTSLGLGEETGNWGNIDDFKWLRAVQSPNWCVIPQEEWVDMVNAAGLQENC